jgi:hypothetical protein
MDVCLERDATMLRFLHSSKVYSLPLHNKYFFLVALRSNVDLGLLSLRILDHTQRLTAAGRTPLNE